MRKVRIVQTRRIAAALMHRAVMFILMLGLFSGTDPIHAQPTESYDLRIPPQPLDSALKAFAAATSLLLSYEAGLTAGRTSPGVSGTYTPEEALQLMGLVEEAYQTLSHQARRKEYDIKIGLVKAPPPKPAYPEPVPISSTLSSLASSSASVMSATMYGCEIVWLSPMGNGVSR